MDVVVGLAQLDGERASLRHRVDGIVDQRRDHVGQLLAVAAHRGEAVELLLELNAVGQPEQQRVEAVAHHRRQRHLGELLVAPLAAELLHALDGGAALERGAPQLLQRL